MEECDNNENLEFLFKYKPTHPANQSKMKG